MNKNLKVALLALVIVTLIVLVALGLYLKSKPLEDAVTLFGLRGNPAVEEITLILKGTVIESSTGRLVVEASGERLTIVTDSGTQLFKPNDPSPTAVFKPEEVAVGMVVRVVGEVEGGSIKANTIIRQEDFAISPIGPFPE